MTKKFSTAKTTNETNKTTAREARENALAGGRAQAARLRLDVAVAAAAGISRPQAHALILAGDVCVDGVTQTKAGSTVRAGADITIAKTPGYVSRGGFKLERALADFAWSPQGLRCLDVGASTGGFTDCLLQRGACSVVAVDVGYGHLAWKLRQDPRVSIFERTNFRYADVAALGAPFDLATADVSFISLCKLADRFAAALSEGGRIIALVKPQFEAGRAAVERGGVVRDPAAQQAAIEAVIAALAAAGCAGRKLTYSPLRGPAGNIEFLLGAQRVSLGNGASRASRCASVRPAAARLDVAGVVRAAHEALD